MNVRNAREKFKKINLLDAIPNPGKTDHGFTLVELLMVMTIIGVLATFAMNGLYSAKEKAKVSRCMSELRLLEKEITAWSSEKGTYPPNLAAINRDTLKDPWGRGYVYALPSFRTSPAALNTDYDLYSLGIDGLTADSINDAESQDDIIRADDGQFVGQASMYTL